MKNFLIFLTLLTSSQTWAMTKDGYTLDDQISFDGKPYHVNGIGMRFATFLHLKIYGAGLYLEEKTNDPKKIIESPSLKILKMKFFHHISAKDTANAWRESLHKFCDTKCPTSLVEKVRELPDAMGDLDTGDEIQYLISPNKVEMALKSGKKRQYLGEDLPNFLLQMWLGDHPPTEELKFGLLGQPKS